MANLKKNFYLAKNFRVSEICIQFECHINALILVNVHMAHAHSHDILKPLVERGDAIWPHQIYALISCKIQQIGNLEF